MAAENYADRMPVDSIAVLGGHSGIVVGLSFIPVDAFEQIRRGGRSAPSMVADACSDLRPDFVFVPSWEPWADEAADRVASCGVDVFWAVPGPFGMIAERDGWAHTLRMTLRDTNALNAEMRLVIPGLLESIRRGAAMGARAIVIAEDMAGAEGMLFSPDYAVEEMMPLLATLAEAAAQEAVPAVLHSDGDVRVLMSSIRHAGFAGLHVGSVDQETFRAVFDSAGAEGLGVLGGLDPDALRAGVDEAVATGIRAGVTAQSGGLLICDDGGITTSAEVAALKSALEAARDLAL